MGNRDWRHPMIALSCTKDAQDPILADPVLNKIVDIIDIRYWHYNTKGLWVHRLAIISRHDNSCVK